MIGPRGIIGILVFGGSAVSLALASVGPIAAERTRELDVISWSDADGEASYRVSGSFDYFKTENCGSYKVEEVRFSEKLPANTTQFEVPPPEDEELRSGGSWSYKVEVVEPAGNVEPYIEKGAIVDGFCSRNLSFGEWVSAQSTGERALGLGALVSIISLVSAAGLVAWRRAS